MYFFLKQSEGTGKDFFTCSLEPSQKISNINWLSGNEITVQDGIFIYNTNSELLPPDFPVTTGSSILFSEKMVNVLISNNIKSFDFYKSKIICKSGNTFNNYYTININKNISCLDKENSIIKIKNTQRNTLRFKKLCINTDLVSDAIKLFRLAEKLIYIIISEDVKNIFIKNELTGIGLEKLCVERDNWFVGMAGGNVDINLD